LKFFRLPTPFANHITIKNNHIDLNKSINGNYDPVDSAEGPAEKSGFTVTGQVSLI